MRVLEPSFFYFRFMQTFRYLSAAIIILLSFTSQATTGYSFRCQKAHANILCLRFEEAQTLIREEIKQNPENTQPYLLENYIDFLTVMIGEQEEDYARLKQQRNRRLAKLASGDASSPWYRYSQAMVYMQCGFARVKFRDFVTAGVELNQAYKLLEENNRRFPEFLPDKVCLGLLHSLIGTVPDSYRWAVRTLKFRGTIRQGLSELQTAFHQSARNPEFSFLYPESAFLLAFTSINLAGNHDATAGFIAEACKQPLQQWIHDSPLMCYALANVYLKTGENDKAISLLKGRVQGKGIYPFYYQDYILGVAKLNRLDKDANIPLLTFVANFKGLNYIKSAYQHIAWYYFINGDMTKYRLYVNRIPLRGNVQVDNDREAMRFAEKKAEQNIHLLKARLLFDGGYYERAMSEIQNFEARAGNTPQREIVECTYRKGRIYDEWGKDDLAIPAYQSVINLGNNQPWYYAANASLQLGMIYENRHDEKMARYYFNKCLSLNFEEYHFSITHKAKAGLNRLDNK